MLAVVRDQDVVTEERPKLGPDFAKGGRSAHIGIGVPVHLGCARRDRAVRPDQRVKPVHDLAVHHAHRPSFDDLAHLHVFVCCFQVKRDVALERGIELRGVHELEGLEQRKGEPVLAAIFSSQNLSSQNLARWVNPGPVPRGCNGSVACEGTWRTPAAANIPRNASSSPPCGSITMPCSPAIARESRLASRTASGLSAGSLSSSCRSSNAFRYGPTLCDRISSTSGANAWSARGRARRVST